MDAIALHQSKLTTPEQAVTAIPSGQPSVYGHVCGRAASAVEGAG
jgi:hypothetical protein